MGKLFEIKNLSKDYGFGDGVTHAIVQNNFDIYEDELICVCGESGSGKTTLLNIIAGLDRPTSGLVLFKNKDITLLSDKELTLFRQKEIGFVFQFFNLIDELSVYQNITLIPGCEKDKEKVKKILEDVGLETKINKYPRELSGGEQQRVSIARAINKPSSIILCDEPTGALDNKTGKEILTLLEKIHNDKHKTIIIVTHAQAIANMCDRIITLKNGRIISDIRNTHKIKAIEVQL